MQMPRWDAVRTVPDSAFGVPGALDWSAMLSGCDPYFVWADLTSTASKMSVEFIHVLVQLPQDAVQRQAFVKSLRAVSTHSHAARSTVTVRPMLVPVSKVPRLVQAMSTSQGALRFEYLAPRALRAAEINKSLLELSTKRLKLLKNKAMDSEQDLQEADDETLEDEGDPPRPSQRMRRPVGAEPPSQQRRFSGEGSRKPRLCLIDDRFNFASPRLRHLTLGDLWQQGGPYQGMQRLDERREHWTLAAADDSRLGAQHGRCLDLQRTRPWTESEVYRRTGYLQTVARWSHGSAVLDIVGGRKAWRAEGASKPVIDLVQLSTTAVVDTGGGSLSGHVLDGIHDALQKAKLGPTGPASPVLPRQPLVVNLSYGHHGGAHDGSSLFETAVEELLRRYENLHIVVAAGNGHLLRAHAHACVPAGKTRVLRVQVPADNPADTFIELWFPQDPKIRLTVTPPGGPTCVLECGHAQVWQTQGNESASALHAALIWPDRVAQSRHGTMALLAIAPTRRSADVQPQTLFQDHALPQRRRAWAPHGVWRIELHNPADQPLQHVHAWAQRADAAPGRERAATGDTGRQAYFLDAVDSQSVPPSPTGTLNGIACLVHPRFHVVGAMRRDDRGLSNYSTAGPTRHSTEPRIDGPDHVVPADDSLLRPGLLTAGMLGSARVRLGGSSMAAAFYARGLFDHLVAGQPASSFGGLPPLGTAPQRPQVRPPMPAHAPALHRGEDVRMDPEAFAALLPRKDGRLV